MEQKLVLVGGPKSHRGKTRKFHNVQFTKGEATLSGTPAYIEGMSKYLETFGAFPAHLAQEKQKWVDEEIRKQLSAKARRLGVPMANAIEPIEEMDDPKAKEAAELAELEQELAALDASERQTNEMESNGSAPSKRSGGKAGRSSSDAKGDSSET